MPKATREFQIFAKPAGALCNLRCTYCYYLDVQKLYPAAADGRRMEEELLEQYIAQHIAAFPGTTVNFSWHGGEPTILGLDYFLRIVALQRKHRRPGMRIVNGIQTNGTLIDETWARFLAAEGFTVGVSLDGPGEFHDPYRSATNGSGSHEKAVAAFMLLRRHGVPCDVLCAVHAHNVGHPLEVYRFFKRIGAYSIGFLPVVIRAANAHAAAPPSVPAEAFGDFLCRIFDEWVRQDERRVVVQLFEEAARPARGLDHSLCIFRETCGDIPVLERNGDFYPCDHYVTPSYRIGNLRSTALIDLLEHPAQQAFGNAKRDTLPGQCRACEFLPLCNGGCPKDRFLVTASGEPGLNYLCAGYTRFFSHVLPYARRLAFLGRVDEPVTADRRPASAARAAGASRSGRNDLCPCGSGRKYKKCCLAESDARD